MMILSNTLSMIKKIGVLMSLIICITNEATERRFYKKSFSFPNTLHNDFCFIPSILKKTKMINNRYHYFFDSGDSESSSSSHFGKEKDNDLIIDEENIENWSGISGLWK